VLSSHPVQGSPDIPGETTHSEKTSEIGFFSDSRCNSFI
jgi:hypothetical protein